MIKPDIEKLDSIHDGHHCDSLNNLVNGQKVIPVVKQHLS